MNAEQQSKVWSQVVARAWADPAFKRRLLADPAAMLKEHGMTVPPGNVVRVLENTDKLIHLTLPTKPKGELSEAELGAVAAAAFWAEVGDA